MVHNNKKLKALNQLYSFRNIYRMFQELNSILQNLIPELILSQKRHVHTHGSNWQRFKSYEFLKYSK